jgi:hypothetical protein
MPLPVISGRQAVAAFQRVGISFARSHALSAGNSTFAIPVLVTVGNAST